MEPIGFFTSRADLPADAVNISADSRRAAALKLAGIICDRTGSLITTSLLTYIVPDAFKHYQPASGATVDPALTRGCLYRYLTRGKLD